MVYEHNLNRYKAITQQIHSLQTQIDNLPDGKFVCSRSGNSYKWYCSDGFKKTYIPKKNRPLAEKLAVKKYLSYQLQDLIQERTALDFYLRHHKKSLGKADRLLLEESGYKELLIPYFKPDSQKLSEWISAPYERNSKYSEQLIHPTASGNLVRSKSEVMIDLYLYKNKIPFRYECALHLGDTVLFPDFTIFHPKTKTYLYWEHFGRMDDHAYATNAFSKLSLYTSYGIFPNIQLITTYETQKYPLSIDMIEKTIQYYFF